MKGYRRKLPDSVARDLRRNLQRRTDAIRMISEGRRILATVPAPSQSARELGIHHTRAVAIARGLAYKDVR